ncbi:MAG: hypothetical protein GC192_21235 [Bacteroidetes bacterium]|nr:hypothetical protein [Bacteroidota bacterium]
MQKHELSLTWQGIAVDVTYVPDYSPSFRNTYGWSLAHLSIQRQGKGQLPMTETGYKSHFTNAAGIEEMGGPEGYVRAWLGESGSSKEWQDYIKQERQLKLF